MSILLQIQHHWPAIICHKILIIYSMVFLQHHQQYRLVGFGVQNILGALVALLVMVLVAFEGNTVHILLYGGE